MAYKNFLRNNSTGAEYNLDEPQSLGPNSFTNGQGQQTQLPAGQPMNSLALDYSSPIEIGGEGKGYRVKGDPFTAILSDGRKVRLGVDTAATNRLQADNLKMASAQQDYEKGAVALQAARGKLDTSAMGEDGQIPELGTMPKNIQDQVIALADGRMPFPSGMALRTPYWQKMLSLVAQHDPSFDAVNYQSRQRTRTDFTAGKSAQSITAFNTVLGHMENLQKAGEGLDNSSSPVWNTVANKAAELTGDPRIRQFNVAKDAVVGELVKAFNNGHITDHQLQEWGSNVSNANSPEQMAAVNKELVSLLGSKINAMGEQYNAGMGTSLKGIQLLSPKSQGVYSKITGEQPPVPTGMGVGQPTAPVSSPRVESDAPPPASRYPGKVMTAPNGSRYKSDGKQWVRM